MVDPAGVQKQRQRLRIACDPCRERKRKCDGGQPCELCAGYEYDCTYRSTPRSRRHHGAADRPQSSETRTVRAGSSVSSAVGPVQSQQQSRQRDGQSNKQSDQEQRQAQSGFVQSAESNSGAAFARLLTMTLDPNVKGIPPMRMLAWNLYLGERQATLSVQPASLTAILSEHEMQHLVAVYFEKVNPCYGFLDQQTLYQDVTNAWHGRYVDDAQCAILCGVGALGSLFSGAQDLTTEQSLVALAKSSLDSASVEPPGLLSATAWVLRTVWLRVTGRPEEAWLSSCTTLHVIDAAGLGGGHGRGNSLKPSQNPLDLDRRRRVFGIAQHMNMWMSYDLGRRRVVLPGSDTTLPGAQPGEYTQELLALLPHTEDLDPGNNASDDSLTSALRQVLDRVHTAPPSVLAQCNLMLCIYRRLHSSKTNVPEELVGRVLLLIEKSVEAVRAAMAVGLPWHHVASMPFQIVCMLLAIDTAQSFALLGNSLACLATVNDTYKTAATGEAVTAAYALVQLHQKRREMEVRKHSEMLNLYPALPAPATDSIGDLWNDFTFLDSWWYNEFANDLDLEAGQSIQTM